MSSKPATAARWADTGSAVVVPPSSGHQDSGWQDQEIVSEGIINWLFYVSYLWQQYLSDGQFSGNHKITGDLEVTGRIYCDTTDSVDIPGMMSQDTAGAHVRQPGTSTNAQIGWKLTNSTQAIQFPVTGVPAGAKIVGYSVYIHKGTTTGTLTTKMYQSGNSAVESLVGPGQAFTSGTPVDAVITETFASPVTVALNSQLYVLLTPSGVTSPANDISLHCRVFYVRTP